MPKKLPHRYQAIVMPLVLSVLMSGIVSFVSTASGNDFQSGLFSLWLKAWAFSWIVAFPSPAPRSSGRAPDRGSDRRTAAQQFLTGEGEDF